MDTPPEKNREQELREEARKIAETVRNAEATLKDLDNKERQKKKGLRSTRKAKIALHKGGKVAKKGIGNVKDKFKRNTQGVPAPVEQEQSTLRATKEQLKKLSGWGYEYKNVEDLSFTEAEQLIAENESKWAEKVEDSPETKGGESPKPEVREVNPTSLTESTEPEKSQQEKQVEDFIAKLKLEGLITPEFNALSVAQKLFVVQKLQNRIVDIVREDARTQYSGDLAPKPLRKKILAGITREKKIKNLEAETFARIQDTEEGKNLIAGDFAQLTRMAQEREIQIGETGKPEIVFMPTLDSDREYEKEAIRKFNTIANKFREIPYEWGQARGKQRKLYDEAKREYEEAKHEILWVKESDMGKQKAVSDILQLDNMVRMEQLLNTHPQVEQEFQRISETADGREVLKTGQNFFKGLMGAKGERAVLFLGGYGLRAATVSMGFAVGLVAPAVGALVGGLRGFVQGEQTLEDRKIQARKGTKFSTLKRNKKGEIQLDKKGRTLGSENIATYDASQLADKLIKIQSKLEGMEAGKNPELLDSLITRVNYTKLLIENGQVNFGDARSSFKNQYILIDAISNAESTIAVFGKPVGQNISKRLESFLQVGYEKLDKRQGKFLLKQALKSATYGAGLASAGYWARWAVEHLGWVGDQSPSVATSEPIRAQIPSTDSLPQGAPTVAETGTLAETLKNLQSESGAQIDPNDPFGAKFIDEQEVSALERARIMAKLGDMDPRTINTEARELNLKGMMGVGQDTTTTPPRVTADTLVTEDGIRITQRPVADSATTPIDSMKVATDSVKVAPDSSVVTPADTTQVAGVEPVAPATPEAIKVPVNPDAVIKQGEGIEHALRRQIENNPELAKSLGFEEGGNIREFSGRIAHQQAIENGYVDPATGQEIWVTGKGGDVAYQFKIENGKVLGIEELDAKTGDILDAHKTDAPFEQDTEKYEYKYNKPAVSTETVSAQPETSTPTPTETTPSVDEARARVLEQLGEQTPRVITPAPEPTELELKDLIEVSNEPTTAKVNPEEVLQESSNERVSAKAYRGEIPGEVTEYNQGKPVLGAEHPGNNTNTPYNGGRQVWGAGSSSRELLEAAVERGVNDFHQANLAQIFPNDTQDVWEGISTRPAKNILALQETQAEDSFKPFVRYVKKLQEVSGLDPKGKVLFFRGTENIEDYIKRALGEIAEKRPDRMAEVIQSTLR